MNDPIVAVEEIDLSTCETLAASLAAPPSGDVVLDCSAVRFIDSSGLRVIVEPVTAWRASSVR